MDTKKLIHGTHRNVNKTAKTRTIITQLAVCAKRRLKLGLAKQIMHHPGLNGNNSKMESQKIQDQIL